MKKFDNAELYNRAFKYYYSIGMNIQAIKYELDFHTEEELEIMLAEKGF
ncbi:MAG: hypothetical protein QM532_04435 [Cyanobium sp. MAG06]|nr:hypothetical protein [Cyanobium sp. MAG06]